MRREQRRLEQEIDALNRALEEKRTAMAAEVEARLHAEKERQLAEQHLRDAQRRESLGVLSGGIAHQFNNLLTIISGHVGLAGGEVAPGSTLAHSLDEIRMASERAAGLCRQLLDAAGHSFAVRRNLDPRALLDQALRQAGRGVVEYLPGLLPVPAVRGVAAQLQQALAAIIQNAQDAVSGGTGRVRIILHDVPLDPQQAARLSSAVRPGRYVCFEVSDNGCGIAPEAIGRIYEPFYTTKGLGRGLGLAAAAGVVRAHGGGIAVESRVGVGSVFRIYLPVVAEAAVN